jgi:hypothetical protein
MDKRDGFLKRWSRLKQTKAEETPPGDAAPPAAASPAEDAVDPASLPPIESLGPDSDYTVFLRKGVPEALRNAALRRAWVMDPVIRNFRTPAEYDWDFTAPGYGALRPGDDVEKLVNQLMGPPEPAEAPASKPGEPAPSAPLPSAPPPPRSVAPPETPRAALPPPAPAAAAARRASGPPPAPPTPRRRHGGAMPE